MIHSTGPWSNPEVDMMAAGGKKSPKRSGKKKKKPVMVSKPPAGDKVDPGIVVEHKHCFNCGISISPDKDICSDRCQAEWDKMLKRKKLMTYLPFIGIALIILFYILIYSRG
jgi:predicted nucleic acid-binding Zn ribbon protein